MDTQDHNNKNGSSGQDNQGVHLCHKCGWPFPNPHPSAKHRRAHKKVCGTIEGYKLIESERHHPQLAVSDDEHASDDDHRTPSPKMQKRSVKERLSSGGFGEKSIASDDEVFTDAATEFSDSGVSPVMKERIKELDKDVEKLLNTEMSESQQLTVDATADIFVQVNDTKESSQENFGIAKYQSESGKSSYGTRIEEFPLGSQFDSFPVESETPPEVLINERNAKVNSANEEEPVVSGDDVLDIDKPMTDSIDSHGKATGDVSKLEFSLEETGQQSSDALTQESLMHKVDEEKESKLDETKEKCSDNLTLETVVQEPVTTDCKLPMRERQTSALSSTNGTVEEKEDGSNKLEASMVMNSVSPLDRPLMKIEGSITALPQDLDGDNYSKIVEAYGQKEMGNDRQSSNSEKEQDQMRISDLKEQTEGNAACNLSKAQEDNIQVDSSTNPKEDTNFDLPEEVTQNMHSLSVPNSLPVANYNECTIERCKDNKKLKYTPPVDLGSAEVITLVQYDNNAPVAQGSDSGLHSVNSSGSLGTSSTDLKALKHDLEEEGVEKSTERKDDISGEIAGSCEIRNSCGLVASSDAPTTDIQNIQPGGSSEGFHIHSSESLAHSEDAVVDHYDTKSAVSAEEVKQATDSCKGETDGNNKMRKSENSVTAKNGTSKDSLQDELSANKKTIQEHADSSFMSEDDQTTGSLKADGNQDHERATVELLDMGRYESTEVGGGLHNTEAEYSATRRLSESTDLDSVPEKVGNARGSTEQAYSGLQKCADGSSQEAWLGSETGNVTDVVESVNYEGSHLPSIENTGDSMSKEAAHLHTVSEVYTKSSATFGLTQTKEAVKSASDCNFEPSQDEGDHRFEKQHGDVSTIDTSVASNSRGDSLEGNWESASVVSPQSDSTPTADAGGLPFSVPQPPEKSVDRLEMPKDETNECRPDKPDASELPSFMTLVESSDCVSRDAAPAIQIVQNIQQPKPEDLQTGLFPSLSNVVNESESGKTNEESIENIQSQSTEKQHSPLKNLLGEAKSPNTKQVPAETQSDAPLAKGTAVTTLNAILQSEEPSDQDTPKDMEKEWNSPARYPSQIKKEKRKGKPYWVPFVCCSSVHRDF